MEIDIELLEKCAVLSDYEKDLIRRVDVNCESQSSVAAHYRKTPSTISIQHKKASAKFTEWLRNREKQKKVPSEEDFDKKIFRMFRNGKLPDEVIEKIGRSNEVLSLWQKYEKLKEDDYYRFLSILGEHGYETNENLSYPLSKLLDDILDEKEVLAAEKEDVCALLEKKGCTKDLGKEAYGSITDGVQKIADELLQTQFALVRTDREKEAAIKELKDMEQSFEYAQEKVLRLQRLEKYEHISEEERKKLEFELAAKRKLIDDLEWKVNELQTSKSRLEEDVRVLRQISAETAKNVRGAVYEYLAGLNFNEVMRLYRDALRSNLGKTIMQ